MTTHVLIPSHGRPRFLGGLLEDLARAKVPESGKVTIWILENGSRQAEEVVPEESENGVRFVYRHYEIGNKSLTLNRALEEVEPDSFLIFLDDDVRLVGPQFILRYVAAAAAGIGHYFGSSVLPAYEVEPDPEVVPYLPASCLPFEPSRNNGTAGFADFTLFLGANWACFARDISAAGGFNPEVGPGSKGGARGQESAAQFSLARNGVKPVVVEGAAVRHHVSARMVSADWIVDRIFHSVIQKGREDPSFVDTCGLLAKLLFSLLGWPFTGNSIGFRYRVAKAAGYFFGLAQRSPRDAAGPNS